MKKEKGFTLIELLAVIVILAIIALIAVPQVLRILNKARLSAAEDSVYGIVKASESYITQFMLKNNGNIPSEDLVFNCESNGCKLENTLEGYNTANLDVLDFKGTTPTSGKITVKNGGKEITTEDLKVNGFLCTYKNEKANCIKGGNTTTTTTPVVPTYYYEFGTPTTSSTTDFSTVEKNVFARLGSDNLTGVCIIDGGLFCINANDYDNSVVAIRTHFGEEADCTDYGDRMSCSSDFFACGADSNGYVGCDDRSTSETCNANADGSFNCFEY